MSEKKVYTGMNDIFYNSDSIFVEFNDIIELPDFKILLYLQDSDIIDNIYDISAIKGKSPEDIFIWYFNRPYKNIFKCFPFIGNLKELSITSELGLLNEDMYSETLLQYMKINLVNIYDSDTELDFAEILPKLAENKMLIHNIYIYNEYYTKGIYDYVKSKYGETAKFVYGDFQEVIKNISSNSTFVFSDMTKVEKLRAGKKIDYSSLILSYNYEYNYHYEETKDGKERVPNVNIYNIAKDHIFKYDFFDVFGSTSQMS